MRSWCNGLCTQEDVKITDSDTVSTQNIADITYAKQHVFVTDSPYLPNNQIGILYLPIKVVLPKHRFKTQV